jgi:hypothetical protein
LDAGAQAISIYMTPAQVAASPTFIAPLVLLAEVYKLLGAPRVACVEQAMKTLTQSDARQYWKK